ncbi:hypothetical protein Tco_1466302 [Tanacetum coccineum]
MIEYFKEKWEELNDESLRYEVEDVINIRSGSAKVMNDNEVQVEKHNEVINLVVIENLQVCAFLETRLKIKKLVKICDRVFREVEDPEPGFELQGAKMVEMGRFGQYFHSYALYLVHGALNLQSLICMIFLDDHMIIWSR